MESSGIVVVEPLCEGNEHAKFNAMLLSSIVLAAGSDRRMTFVAEHEHCSSVSQQLGATFAARVQFAPIRTRGLPVGGKVRKLVLMLLVILASLIRRGRFIFLSANTSVLGLSLLLRRTRATHFVLHSYYPDFLTMMRAPLIGFEGLRARLIARFSRVVVLRSDLVQPALGLRRKVDIISIEHPLRCERRKRKGQLTKRLVRVGFLGRATPEKGFDRFTKLSKLFGGGRIRFSHIGPSTRSSSASRSAPRFITSTEFEKRIRALDYIFYANKASAYKYIASGVLGDALGNGVNLIGVRDPFITYLEKKFGPIGSFEKRFSRLLPKFEKIVKASGRKPPRGSVRLVAASRYNSPRYVDAVRAAFNL